MRTLRYGYHRYIINRLKWLQEMDHSERWQQGHTSIPRWCNHLHRNPLRWKRCDYLKCNTIQKDKEQQRIHKTHEALAVTRARNSGSPRSTRPHNRRFRHRYHMQIRTADNRPYVQVTQRQALYRYQRLRIARTRATLYSRTQVLNHKPENERRTQHENQQPKLDIQIITTTCRPLTTNIQDNQLREKNEDNQRTPPISANCEPQKHRERIQWY